MTLPNRTANTCAEPGAPALVRELRRLEAGFHAARGEPYAPIQRRVAALRARVCARVCVPTPGAAPRD